MHLFDLLWIPLLLWLFYSRFLVRFIALIILFCIFDLFRLNFFELFFFNLFGFFVFCLDRFLYFLIFALFFGLFTFFFLLFLNRLFPFFILLLFLFLRFLGLWRFPRYLILLPTKLELAVSIVHGKADAATNTAVSLLLDTH